MRQRWSPRAEEVSLVIPGFPSIDRIVPGTFVPALLAVLAAVAGGAPGLQVRVDDLERRVEDQAGEVRVVERAEELRGSARPVGGRGVGGRGAHRRAGELGVQPRPRRARARAVAALLRELAGGRPLLVRGVGEGHRVATNRTAHGRARNRRVTIRLG
ncbi:MAG: hypothetical protein M3P39_08930 [Actinomycetota bacterium]|nr:hypothetical protein [Actinomycetota bacterium]